VAGFYPRHNWIQKQGSFWNNQRYTLESWCI
jgi:hypothetical protein